MRLCTFYTDFYVSFFHYKLQIGSYLGAFWTTQNRNSDLVRSTVPENIEEQCVIMCLYSTHVTPLFVFFVGSEISFPTKSGYRLSK